MSKDDDVSWVRDESAAASAARHIDTRLLPRMTRLENVAEAAVLYFRVARQLQIPGEEQDARRILEEMNEALALLVVALDKAGYRV